ncbi:MAG: hypothetical protein N3F05_04350 [Candidatus Diapherotrites archaeon]|nr:hypothetical protein [Candidatus Diapherotrites archaeon]
MLFLILLSAGVSANGDGPICGFTNLTKSFYGPISWPDEITGTASYGNSGVDEVRIAICYDTDSCWDGDSWEEGVSWVSANYEGGTWSYSIEHEIFENAYLNGEQINVRVKAIVDGNGNICNQYSFTWDQEGPSVEINWLNVYYGPLSWPGEITGTASDELSDVNFVIVTLCYTAGETQYCWNGSEWSEGDPTRFCPEYDEENETWVLGDMGANTFDGLDGVQIDVKVFAVDKAGNESEWAEYSFTWDETAPKLMEEGSIYRHGYKELILIFDDKIMDIVDETKILVSYDPQVEGFAIDEGDICFSGYDYIVCYLSIVHRDLIQSWYNEGHRTLYIFVGAGAVQDKAGNLNEDTNTTIDVYWIPKAQGSLNLAQGWNFISIPFKLANNSSQEVLGLEEGDAIYHYYNGTWTQPTALEPLKGYLVYKATPGTRETIYDYSCGIQEVPPSVTVAGNKWNMIGPDTHKWVYIDKFLETSKYNYIGDKIFTYSNILGTYIKETYIMTSGTGYWVFFRATAVVPGSPCYDEGEELPG